MRRRAVLLAGLCGLSGCFGGRIKADRLMMAGKDDLNTKRYEHCVQNTTAAIPVYQTIINNPRTAVGNRTGSFGGLAYSYSIRAKCRWGLNQHQEAISDMETGIKMLNERCHTDLGLMLKSQQERECQSVANDIEILANWMRPLRAAP